MHIYAARCAIEFSNIGLGWKLHGAVAATTTKCEVEHEECHNHKQHQQQQTASDSWKNVHIFHILCEAEKYINIENAVSGWIGAVRDMRNMNENSSRIAELRAIFFEAGAKKEYAKALCEYVFNSHFVAVLVLYISFE